MPMVRGYRWMYRTARPAIDMSTMPGRGCIFHDIGNYPSRDHDTRKYHLSFGGACQTPIQWPTTTRFSLSPTIFTPYRFPPLRSPALCFFLPPSIIIITILTLVSLSFSYFLFSMGGEENNFSPTYELFIFKNMQYYF